MVWNLQILYFYVCVHCHENVCENIVAIVDIVDIVDICKYCGYVCVDIVDMSGPGALPSFFRRLFT